MLAQLEGNWRVLDWSPDDAQLLVMESVSSSGETYLWTMDARTGAKRALTSRDEGQVLWVDARFSADGGAVYALGDRGQETQRLWRYGLGTRSWRAVTAERDVVEAFEESPDGKYLAVAVDRDAVSHLEIIHAQTGRKKNLPALPAGVITKLSWHPKGGELGFVFAGARTFSDVYSVRLGSAVLERWTASEAGGANPESLP
jgi:Tol biopolymer transport system component